jgi:hypothetical protein
VLGVGSPTSPLVVEVDLGLSPSTLSSATSLSFQCHRCGFYAAPEYEATTTLPATIKASVRVIGGGAPANDANVPWVNVTDANVTLADAERVQGGVNGAFYTTHITLPLTAAMKASLVGTPSYNRVQFRFNGTDGSSNGYRILALGILDQNGNNLMTNPVAQFDPTTERSTSGFATSDVTAGQTLWYGTNTLTKSSIVSRVIGAACNSCHAKDARDLQYFNYSNNSIIQRAQFHGLTAAQGQQIAEFVRSVQQSLPYAANARPWNPPYQPGPGLDCTGPGCEVNWSAGAGLGAVLDSPAEAVNAIFGQTIGGAVSLTQANIDAVMNPAIDLNARQTQVPIQFPDWNAWLPPIYPGDVWPQISGTANSFANGAQWSGDTSSHNPYGDYTNIISFLTKNTNPDGVFGDWSNLTPALRYQAKALFYAIGWDAYEFLGGVRGNHIATTGLYGAQVGGANMQALANAATEAVNSAQSFTTNSFIERSMESLLHWNAVKQWEMAQTFGLQGNQQWFIGSYTAATGSTPATWTGSGEAHGWPFQTPGLFYLGPHMEYQADVNSAGQVTRQYIMSWQVNNLIGSYYSTDQWYQLALTINPGGRGTFANYPLDWDYLQAFDLLTAQTLSASSDAASQTEAQNHYTRDIENIIKMAQYVDNSIPLWDPTQPNPTQNEGQGSRAQGFKYLVLNKYTDERTSVGLFPSNWHYLDTVQSGLYLKVENGLVNQFNVLYAQTQPSAWMQCDPTNTSYYGVLEAYVAYCLPTAWTPLGTTSAGAPYILQNSLDQTTYQQDLAWSVYEGGQMGIEATRLQTLTNWVNTIWPPQTQ